MDRKKPRSYYGEQIDAALSRCRQEIAEAARDYRAEIEACLDELRDNTLRTSKFIH